MSRLSKVMSLLILPVIVLSFQGTILAQDDPETAADFVSLGLTLAPEGDLEQAIEAFDQALALDPAFVDAYLWRGLAYSSLEEADMDQATADWEQAVELYTVIIENEPAAMETAITLLRREVVLGMLQNDVTDDVQTASDILSEIIEAEPENGIAYYHRALANFLLDEHDSGIADFEMAVELDDTVAERLRADQIYAFAYTYSVGNLTGKITQEGIEELCPGSVFLCSESDQEEIGIRLIRPLELICKYVTLVGEENAIANATGLRDFLEFRTGKTCGSL